MDKIDQNIFADSHPLQNVYHVGLYTQISSPMKLCLFSCRMSEKTIFISVDLKAIICGFTV